MSVKNNLNELNKINTEIKRLSENIRNLRSSAKEVESRVVGYLNEKEQPGVKYNGNSVVIENKEKRAPKKKEDREEDALKILRLHGIHNARDVLNELLEARKGDRVNHQKLKIKAFKPVV
jgi:hypothetical protein